MVIRNYEGRSTGDGLDGLVRILNLRWDEIHLDGKDTQAQLTVYMEIDQYQFNLVDHEGSRACISRSRTQ